MVTFDTARAHCRDAVATIYGPDWRKSEEAYKLLQRLLRHVNQVERQRRNGWKPR